MRQIRVELKDGDGLPSQNRDKVAAFKTTPLTSF
jgi:hypothetical protein